MKKNKVYILFIVFCLYLVSCGNGATSSNNDSGTFNDSEPVVGTIIGNPPAATQVKSLIDISLTEEDIKEKNENNYCIPVPQGLSEALAENLNQTKLCLSTPFNLSIGLLKLNLLTCDTETCDPKMHQRVTLFESSNKLPRNMTISEEKSVISANLLAMTAVTKALGVESTIAYLGYTIPTLENDPTEAKKFVPPLQGASIRICTAPVQFSQINNTPLFPCGAKDSKFGDILFDLNGDGFFGYLTPQLQEVNIKPEAYPLELPELELMTYFRDENGVEEVDNNKNSDTYNFFKPISMFDKEVMVNPQQAYQVHLVFNHVETLNFIDGVNLFESSNKPICVESHTKSECPQGNTDKKTPRVYHPIFDLLFPLFPHTEATLELFITD